ncbi:hypothetical protein ACFPYI_10265 [Halomarina salina]|uniref:Uncharacterized protein n=1 Tax=Halomarina salina TaxID=1872699 RepID=A0ABD5RMS0_9EURY|nr:hypothetical protein [Halomarina salina]
MSEDDTATGGTGSAEKCGRCAMTSVTGTFEHAEDPFAGDRIEVDDRSLRAASPSAWLSGVRDRLDAMATRFVHGR